MLNSALEKLDKTAGENEVHDPEDVSAHKNGPAGAYQK